MLHAQFSPWHLDKEFARIVIESSDVDVESIILLHSNEYVYKSALANNWHNCYSSNAQFTFSI